MTIVKRYDIRNRLVIYRHAHAFGLFKLREKNCPRVLEQIMTEAENTRISAHAIVQAFKAYVDFKSPRGSSSDRSRRPKLPPRKLLRKSRVLRARRKASLAKPAAQKALKSPPAAPLLLDTSSGQILT
jgi:hypothetical protein